MQTHNRTVCVSLTIHVNEFSQDHWNRIEFIWLQHGVTYRSRHGAFLLAIFQLFLHLFCKIGFVLSQVEECLHCTTIETELRLKIISNILQKR